MEETQRRRRANRLGLLSAAVLALGAIAVYSRTFSVPLLLDDIASIADNPTIRHLWPVWPVLAPPSGGTTVSGRPVLNLTLAVNYALGGTGVWGYHAFNLAIHILAGLVLFGIARRIFPSSSTAAFGIALIWTLHPLQTESVTYVVQRAESLMGLFYLLTLYCFIRHAENQDGGRPAGWRHLFPALSVFFCLLGMATKEVMVSAPVVALLYDRTFLAGSFRDAWRRRKSTYLGLASTWILLGYLVIGGGGNRSGSVGFGAGVSWRAYSLTQFQAIAHYLRLTVWPHPLIFDYGTFWVKNAWQVIPYAIVVVPLVAFTILALRRWPAWGFLGFWFFAILAPTSLIPGTTQMIVEHRMYLALAPLLIAIVAAGRVLMRGRLATIKGYIAPGPWSLDHSSEARDRGSIAGLVILIVFAGACAILTSRRNEDYRSALSIWSDTVAKDPANARALTNLATSILVAGGRTQEAIADYEEALRQQPDFTEAHDGLARVLATFPGRLNEALAQCEEALREVPDFAAAHCTLGYILARMPGRSDDAIAQYREALRLKPDLADAHVSLGDLWLGQPGRLADAIAEYQAALRFTPDSAEAHQRLGSVWLDQPGKLDDAIAELEAALRLKPDYTEAHAFLGNALMRSPGRLNDAIVQYQEALRQAPDSAELHSNLGFALNAAGRTGEAIAEDEDAVRLKPEVAELHSNLAIALDSAGRTKEAIAECEAALKLKPDLGQARQMLARIRAAQP
ncbi:MAG: tetratricopeptide repeat protein [Opitutaceae bacterium]